MLVFLAVASVAGSSGECGVAGLCACECMLGFDLWGSSTSAAEREGSSVGVSDCIRAVVLVGRLVTGSE